MRIERTKNASRNITFGILLKIIQIVIPFLLRSAMTYFIGFQYLGLNSLFTSVLQVLNLAELGVGSAMVYSMYKPIVDDDTKSICALMKMYRLYYRVIGLIVLLSGLILLPFLPKLIKGNVPADINIYVLYLLNLSATVLSYWLFAYKNSLLQAHQRTDITSKVMLITNMFQYVLQFLVLWLFKNYYLYVIVMLFTQALTNIITAIIVSKMFPNYNPEGKLEKEEIKKLNGRIRDLFTSKIGSVIVNSADTIVVSAFLGLTMLAIYQNYYFIISAIISFITIGFNACTAGIGNSLIVETQEKNFNDLKKFTFLISWIAGVCSCCCLCVFQPFMKIWMGDDKLLPYNAVICFVIYFFVYEINSLLNTYKDAGGIWKEDRLRPLTTALTNLCMNLIMVQFWGIYGVLLSTVISTLIVGMPWLFYNLFHTLFKPKFFIEYMKKLLIYFIVTILVCAVSAFICISIPFNGVKNMVVCIFVSLFISNVAFFLCYRKTKEFYEGIVLIDSITKGKLRLSERLFKN